MAMLISNIARNVISQSSNILQCGFQQVRHKWVNKWMKRDVKRRKLVKEFAPLRLRYIAMKRNNILPPELREIASEEIDKTVPRQACPRQIMWRCTVTSRPRGVVYRWRVSRFIFRHLVDYNKLSGVMRARW